MGVKSTGLSFGFKLAGQVVADQVTMTQSSRLVACMIRRGLDRLYWPQPVNKISMFAAQMGLEYQGLVGEASAHLNPAFKALWGSIHKSHQTLLPSDSSETQLWALAVSKRSTLSNRLVEAS